MCHCTPAPPTPWLCPLLKTRCPHSVCRWGRQVGAWRVGGLYGPGLEVAQVTSALIPLSHGHP